LAREQRRLAAIVSADVAGYSRLMGRDESGTLAALKQLRREVIDPPIAAYGGRIVKTTGDGLLLEFPSVVDAVLCMIEVQTAMAERNAAVPEERRIIFRIGIHLGDVIIDGHDIFGDGVNIAARLEAVAQPGGLCVSQAVYDSVRRKIDATFVDGGSRDLKNITTPIPVWHWRTENPTQAGAAAGAWPRTNRDKPAIAVLPFENMSRNPDQEYFSDGIAEDIITNLSKFRDFHVIARNSTFIYKGTSVDVAKVGRELKTDYVVEGSVRSTGSRVRITAQLINVSNGAHVWAERYDRDLTDIFEVQDEITARIASAVDPAIRSFEMQAAMRKHPTSLDAWDHVLRGLWHLNQFKKLANAAAREEFEAAIAIDARYALPNAWLALTHVFDAWFNWTDTHAVSLDRAHQAVAGALRLDDTEPMCHVASAVQCFWSGRMEQARTAADRALALNPNSFLANYIAGGALNYSGQCEAALPHNLKALDLSPNDPFAWNCLGSFAHAHLNLGNYDEAIAVADRAIVLRHGYLFARVVRAAALAHSGRLREAKESVSAILEIAPDFSMARLSHYPFVIERQRQHLLTGLALAGVPTVSRDPTATQTTPSAPVGPLSDV